ncbi:related to TAF5 - TFIID and SAGA subunit [Pseudozyma flocculosa]|uniref:Related to TAF5 - TFIID and SAGA subunit n=1 Tax=Pseudozyma flocculosa TaxID=84751 RepID=A0A5C3F2F2_9BASI|nr:related to TAF5 - TFIID and SAGA subunit [Pseudozyma flocculosa]
MVATPDNRADGSSAAAPTSAPAAGASAAAPAAASSTTPAAAASAPAKDPSANGTSHSADQTAAILTYLQRRGFTRAEAAFKAEVDAFVTGATPQQAAAAADVHGRPPTVSLDDLAAKNAPRDLRDKEHDSNGDERDGAAKKGAKADAAARDRDKDKDKDKDNVFGAGDDADASTAAAQALLLDPTDRARGFNMLRSWCQGSLDVYQPELLPILLPLFVHSFIDLVSMGHVTAASAFYAAHSASFLPTHTALLSQIRSLALPSHILSDPLAHRFRTERYVLKMSNTVFSLLLGWLTDGSGPAAGSASSTAGLDEADAPARRGREAMLKIVNERCRIQVLAAQPYQIDASVLEEGTGLTGAGPSYSSHPIGPSSRSRQHAALSKNAVTEADAVAEFNAKAAGPQLKLHPALPLSERLQTEVEKELKEVERKEREEASLLQQQQQQQQQHDLQQHDLQQSQQASTAPSTQTQEPNSSTQGAESTSTAPTDPPTQPTATQDGSGDTTMEDASTAMAKAGDPSARAGPDYSVGLLAPQLTDLPPQAPTFRTVDVKREVQRVKDARKRIRLDPSLLTAKATTGGAPSTHSFRFSSGVRDASINALGEEGARAARHAALPSVCAYTYHDADDGVTCSTFSQDVSLMAAGFEESFVQVWSLKGEKLRGLKGDPHLGGARDRRSLERQREAQAYTTRKLIGHSGPVYGVDFDPVGGSASAPKHLLSSSADGTARLWSLETFGALVAYRGHQHPVWDVKWSPLGTYFATASADKTARLWSTERINPLRMYAGHLSDVDCLAFHPNSLYLATGSSDRTVRLWDVQRGACVRLFVGHQSPISCLEVSPDGKYLASASTGSGTASPFGNEDPSSISSQTNDVSISLWDLASGRRIKKMWGHRERVNSMSFSADGSILVTGGQDRSVRCWDVRAVGGQRKAASSTIASADTGVMASSTPASAAVAAAAAAAASVATPTAASRGGAAAAAAAAAAKVDWHSSADCIATFYTKGTPLVDVKFTPRNLCLVAGVYGG